MYIRGNEIGIVSFEGREGKRERETHTERDGEKDRERGFDTTATTNDERMQSRTRPHGDIRYHGHRVESIVAHLRFT